MVFRKLRGIFQNNKYLSRLLTKDKLSAYLRSVEGQISVDEQYLLYEYAKKVNEDDCIVEIGSYRGKSSLCLGLGSLHGKKPKVYTIDPHATFVGINGGVFGSKDMKEFYKNVINYHLGETIYQISLPSFDVGKTWRQRIGLLWIDGDHSYEGVKQDFVSFSEHVVGGGYILFHDAYMKSVQRLINEVKENKIFTHVGTQDSISIFMKK